MLDRKRSNGLLSSWIIKKQKMNRNVDDGKVFWIKEDDYCYVMDFESRKSSREYKNIVGFDLDDTLITPKSGKRFPIDCDDWKWLYPSVPKKLEQLKYEEESLLLIFSNKLQAEKNDLKLKEFQTKMELVFKDLGFPILTFFSTGRDLYRKPNTKMWDLFLEKYNSCSSSTERFFVGDAAGRTANKRKKKDFSCSDRVFAYNCNLKFQTPEEFFLSSSLSEIEEYDWRTSFDPKEFLEEQQQKQISSYSLPCLDQLQSNERYLIVMCGFPSSGKSTFVKRHILNSDSDDGFCYLSKDDLKTKYEKVLNEKLRDSCNIVCDNTHPKMNDRLALIQLTNRISRENHIVYIIRCYWMQTNEDFSKHLNVYRQRKTNGETKQIPSVAYNYFKKHFQPPRLDEGFDSIEKIDFIPEFQKDNDKKLFLQRV